MKNTLFILLSVVCASCTQQHPTIEHLIRTGEQMETESRNKRVARTFEQFIASPGYRTSRDIWRGAAIEQYNPRRTRVEILLNQQRGRLYINDCIAMDFPACTGKDGKYETPKGQFRITEKKREHHSSLYGSFVDAAGDVVKGGVCSADTAPAGSHFEGTKLPYWMRFNGAIGMHTGHVYREGVSHGCVRIPPEACSIIFAKTTVGTPVIVK